MNRSASRSSGIRQPLVGSSRIDVYAWRIIAVSVLLLPLLAFPTAKDTFRLPKELLLRFEAICLILLAVFSLTRDHGRTVLKTIPRRSSLFILGATILLWTGVTAATSTNWRLSAPSVAHAVIVAVIFFATYIFSENRPIGVIHLLLLPAAANAIIVTGQVFFRWNPFTFSFDLPRQLQGTGLVGNQSDVGSFLLPCTLAALAMTLSARKRKGAYGAISLLLAFGIILTETYTAMIALLTTAVLVGVLKSRRAAITIVCVIAFAAFAMLALYPPLSHGVRRLSYLARVGRYDELVSNRVTSYVTALGMAADDPWTGLGPGTFGWNYLPYRIRLQWRNPELVRPIGGNFGEVHNDHLEIAAETGAPGYLLYLAAIGILASRSFRGSRPGDERNDFARLLALPLACSLFILSLGQFPLQIAAPTAAYVYLAALCTRWTEPA